MILASQACQILARFWTGIYIIGSPVSQVFGLGLELYIGFPGSPAYQLHILGLRLHNHVSQSLYIYRYR